MKRIFSLVFCLCTVLNTFSQKIESGSFDGLKNVDKLAIDLDFSHASIHGMNENAFSEYEKDWYTDKPDIVGDFIGCVASKIDGEIVVTDKSETSWLLRINVISISSKGNFVCTADLIDGGNIEAHVVGIHGSGGTFGSKLNLIKDGVKTTSKNCGSFMKKVIRKAKNQN